ncbi:hypothetical protein [Muricoccus roseus]|uniref:hypothetical protein n=1 Tax=Muricoccus roseus TaxID=198092 RepID=UPI001114D931|nr:hypothetical protein [Roseomonas rosea]
MTTKHSRTLIVFAVAVMLLSSAFLAKVMFAQEQNTSHSRKYFFSHSSIETWPVRFVDGGISFVLPRNMLTSLGPPPSANSRPFILGMGTIPGLRGADADTISCFGDLGLTHCDVVQFNYTGARTVDRQEFNRRRTFFLGDTSEPERFDFGLLRTKMPNTYVHVNEISGLIIPISCSPLSNICQLVLDVRNTRWRLRFRVDILHRWREITDLFVTSMEERVR